MQKSSLTAWLLMALLGPVQAQAQSGMLLIELNKLEETDTGGCRAFFLFRNQTETNFEGFSLSLATFDTSGVIDRLLSIDAAPLPAARTTLKLFEIPETACGGITEILVHEIENCRPQNEEEMDCFPLLDFGSRAPVALVK